MPNVPQVAPSASNQMVTIKSLMNNDAVKQRFEEILGKKAAGFVSSVISVANSSALIGADPKTILNAAVVAATLDLPINPSLGFAYIVKYNNKGQSQAQFQLGYKGFIQLAQRSGQYETINATEVREGELIESDILTGVVKIKALDHDREKAKVIGYAAYFKLVGGFSKTIYMSVEEVEAHAKKFSQSYRNDKYNSSLWSTQFDTMAKKTVLKLLLSRFGPLTIDMQMQKAINYDQAVVTNADNISQEEFIPDGSIEYVDNEPVAETPEDAPKNSKMKDVMESASSLFENENK